MGKSHGEGNSIVGRVRKNIKSNKNTKIITRSPRPYRDLAIKKTKRKTVYAFTFNKALPFKGKILTTKVPKE